MKLEHVKKEYHLKKKTIEVLKNIHFEFKPNNFYVIRGESGSGKSTLIRMLGLLDSNFEGEYFINNQNVSKLSKDNLAELRRDTIGFVFQDYHLDENLNALDNVILPMLINPKIEASKREDKAKKLLKEMGLEERLYHYPKELSGGEAQRVAIARALANDPSIILADEPTGNLDEKNEEIILKILKDMSKHGKCVIVVTHSKNAESYADTILEIKDGKLDLK